MINNNTKKYIHPKKNIEKFKNNSKNNSTINNNTNSNINEFIKYSSWNNENDDILKGLYELGFDIFKISKSISWKRRIIYLMSRLLPRKLRKFLLKIIIKNHFLERYLGSRV